MKRIVSISLGSSKRDYEFTTTLLGQEINVKRLGTDGNVQQLEALLREYDGCALATRRSSWGCLSRSNRWSSWSATPAWRCRS